MSATFTRAEVEAVAALAHLDLEATEIDMFAKQLGDILTYVSQLQQIDTDGVPPTVSVAADHEGDRADVVVPSIAWPAALGNAPDPAPAAGLFKVPRVL
jgi:aspartyl-tRNA(Asn)/glutamyl-tRNA(Gln) amidotransferase subunit C